MARGFTDIKLVGGARDGLVIEKVELRGLPKEITFDSEAFFSEIDDGGMAIKIGGLDDSWSSFSKDVYAKKVNEKYKSGTVYEFVETRMVERCTAITKSGERCLKPALNGKSYCSSVHKSK
jgi:hypothetical protein